jgi:hypothetical protein
MQFLPSAFNVVLQLASAKQVPSKATLKPDLHPLHSLAVVSLSPLFGQTLIQSSPAEFNQ